MILLNNLLKYKDYDTKNHHMRNVSKNYGKYCFVSCWTYEKEESIAMWDMYGDRKQGVRLSLPQKMFDASFDINAHNKKPNRIYATKSTPIQPEFFYVDYSRLDDPKIITKDWKIEIGNLGRYKLKDWEFQKECRFRIYASKETKSNEEFWFVPPKRKNLEEMLLRDPSAKNMFHFH